MAFFRKNKKNKAVVEEKTPSAEIARQRAEDIHSNYDGDDFTPSEEPIEQQESMPTQDDLDQILSGNLDDDMLAFDDEVEADLAQHPSEKEETVPDLFDGIELPENGDGELSEVDSSFEDIYGVEGEIDDSDLVEDVSKESDEESDLEESSVGDSEDSEDLAKEQEDLTQDLAKSLTESLEDSLIKSNEPEESTNGMATKSQVYMAMQVFDSESGDFNLQDVDNQLIFDTDDEESFGFSCNKPEKEVKAVTGADDFIFDSSKEA